MLAVLGAATAVRPVSAAFTATTSNSGNTLTAAASFPTYPTSVTGGGAWAYHRGEEAASSAATSTAADSSGNARSGTYDGRTNGLSTHWKLDEGTGAVAADSSGAANTGSIGGGNTWLTDRTDSVLNYNGTTALTGYIQSAGPAVRTDQSFTVATWVYPTNTSGSKAAVSQAGGIVSGFYLLMQGSFFKFVMPQDDLTTATADSLVVAATANTWTHLAGVFDSGAQVMRFYVNGTLRGSTGHSVAWNAGGSLHAGRSWYNSSFGDAWAGRLDDIRTYRRALSATDIDAIHDDPSVDYTFEENAGTTTADRSGNGNTATLTGAGTTWSSGSDGGYGVAFNGNAANAVTAAAAVTTNASFSVAAWVYPTNLVPANQALVSQSGTNSSGFILKISYGKWTFSTVRSDIVTPTVDDVISPGNASANTWTHVAAVYNAASSPNLTLYVNGSSVATLATATPFSATGAFQIGRTWFDNGHTDAFNGSVDDVRAYRRALTAAEVADIRSPPAFAGMTAGLPGALQGTQQGLQSTTAVAFNGTSSAHNNTPLASPGPATFTLECWFKIGPDDAGGLIGYNSVATGLGGSYDRVLYMDIYGKLRFGVNPGTTITVASPLSYDDGAWHHVAATLGPVGGMKLYVDGVSVAAPNSTTTAGSNAGYWRWGGTKLTGWISRPDNPYLVGTLDEVAIYDQELTAQQIGWHYHANH